MEKRIHLYINRKNMAVWLMVLCMAASVASRIVLFGSAGSVWWQVVIPAAATVLYALTVLLCGREMFYKTAIAIWLLGLSAAMQIYGFMQGYPFLYGAVCLCILFLCVTYTYITSGRIR